MDGDGPVRIGALGAPDSDKVACGIAAGDGLALRVRYSTEDGAPLADTSALEGIRVQISRDIDGAHIPLDDDERDEEDSWEATLHELLVGGGVLTASGIAARADAAVSDLWQRLDDEASTHECTSWLWLA